MVDFKKKIKTVKNKLQGKKELKTSAEVTQSIQDTFALFLQKVHDLRIANYLKVKDLCYDYTEIMKLFFGEKDEELLKKLILSLFVPFLYAELTVKERKTVEKHVITLHDHFVKLLKDVLDENQPSMDFRKTFLPTVGAEDKKEEDE